MPYPRKRLSWHRASQAHSRVVTTTPQGFGAIATRAHAAADPGVPATGRWARGADAEGLGVAAAGGVGGPAGQHAESRAALTARAGRRGRAVDVGGSLARPAVGAPLQHLRRRRSATSRCSRWGGFPTTPRAACGPSGWPSGCTPHLDGARMTDRRGRARARCRQRDQVRGDDGHGRDPLGGRAGADRLDGRRCRDRPGRRVSRARSALPPRLRADHGRRASPAGRGSRGARRPLPSPRSKGRSCRSDRRSATSGCSQTTSRRCAPPRRPPRPRVCCRAAMPTSCSTEQSGSCSSRGRISGSGSGRPACGRARSSSRARSAEPGDGRSTSCGSTPGQRLSRERRDAVEAEAAALPLPGLDRPIEVVWNT